MKKTELEQIETKNMTLPTYINHTLALSMASHTLFSPFKNSQMLCNSDSERLTVAMYIPGCGYHQKNKGPTVQMPLLT